MNFIERLFHTSPDGGNGSLEAACLLIMATLLAAPLVRMATNAARRYPKTERQTPGSGENHATDPAA